MNFNVPQALDPALSDYLKPRKRIPMKNIKIPRLIAFFLLPLLIPISVPFIPIVAFFTLGKTSVGLTFAAAEVLTFGISALVVSNYSGGHGTILYDFGLLFLFGPVLIIHFAALAVSLSRFKRLQHLARKTIDQIPPSAISSGGDNLIKGMLEWALLGNKPQAIEALSKAQETLGGDASLWNWAGAALYEMKEYRLSLDAFKRAKEGCEDDTLMEIITRNERLAIAKMPCN